MQREFSPMDIEQALDQALLDDFPSAIDFLAEKCAAAAGDLRQAISGIYTQTDVGVYWHPALEKAALYVRPRLDEREFGWCRQSLSEKVGSERVLEHPLTPEDLQGWWVKVAYSPTIRRGSELLQFLPSKEIPGFGGRPIASMIASGLLGAGLGYGGGLLAEKVLPEKAKEKGQLAKRLAVAGGLGGASLGALPGLVNWHDGRSFNDNELWSGFPDEGWEPDLAGEQYKQAIDAYLHKEAYDGRFPGISSTIGGPSFAEDPLIRVNELGQVLWGTRADPQTTAMTTGAIHGASRMPDRRARPGTVTSHQTGLLGMAMGAAGGGLKGYIVGSMVGKGLGLLTGMPKPTQNKLVQTGTALGVVNSLVPKLFN